VEARDYGRQQRPREWALFTGRYDTAFLMERLMAQPCAEQFCTTFSLEWPMLKVCTDTHWSQLVVTIDTPHSTYTSRFIDLAKNIITIIYFLDCFITIYNLMMPV